VQHRSVTVLNRGRDAVFHCNGAAEVTGANPLCIDPIIIIIIVIDISFIGAGSRQCVVPIDHLGRYQWRRADEQYRRLGEI